MEEELKNKRLWKFFAGFVILLLLGSLIPLGIEQYRKIEARKAYEKMTKPFVDFEKVMRADAYGGKTPEETIRMFIEALEKGDVELASKYFVLDTNMNSPDYLKRKYEGVLRGKTKEEVSNIVGLMKRVSLEGNGDASTKNFAARSEDGFDIFIVLRLNEYSGVWKIESM